MVNWLTWKCDTAAAAAVRTGSEERRTPFTRLQITLHDFAQNRIWVAVCMLAAELTTWMQLLALAGTDARTWEPKRLRLRLFSMPAKLGRRNRRIWLRFPPKTPHPQLILVALQQLTTKPLNC